MQSMQLSKDKIGYTINYGIAPHLNQLLIDDISKSPFFVCGFDESLNKVSHRGQMDVHVRFWMDDTVMTRYLTSQFLGHATAPELLKALETSLKNLDTSKLVQISMDGPNVNHAAFRLMKEAREHDTEFLEIGTCSLHIVDGALRHADKVIKIMRFLRCCWEVFKNLPSRRADYLHYAVTNNPKLPPKYCATRWVENVRVAEAIIEEIPNLESYVENVAKINKEPQSDSYKMMKDMLKDPLLKSRLCIFVTVAKDLEIFLKRFQNDKPMVPFLYEAFEIIQDNLLKRFIKPSVINNLSTAEKLKIAMYDENFSQLKDIDIGFATKSAIRCADSSQNEKMLFLKECQEFLKRIFVKLQKKSPLKFPIVEGSA